MLKKQRSRQFVLWRWKGRVCILFFLLMFPLCKAISGYLQRKTIITKPEAAFLYFANFFVDTVSEIGVPAVLFGISLCTFLIGLRMVLYPASKRTRY